VKLMGKFSSGGALFRRSPFGFRDRVGDARFLDCIGVREHLLMGAEHIALWQGYC
jgi:hypothetical protein